MSTIFPEAVISLPFSSIVVSPTLSTSILSTTSTAQVLVSSNSEPVLVLGSTSASFPKQEVKIINKDNITTNFFIII
ncbi:MAG: hypothetical protein LBC61_01305 [Candidatus Peribacteria bacterium]|nr:hypothetical protein [Candidatus Peribacteria bacterium]